MLYREKRLATVAKKKNNGLMIHFENWSVDSKKRREIRKEEMGLGGYKLTHLHLFYIDRSFALLPAHAKA